MARAITERQQQILDLLNVRGPMKSITVGRAIGVSQATAYQHLLAMERKGLVGKEGTHFLPRPDDHAPADVGLLDEYEVLNQIQHAAFILQEAIDGFSVEDGRKVSGTEMTRLVAGMRAELCTLFRRFQEVTNRGANVAPASLPKEERSMNTTDEAKPAETPATEAAAPPTGEAPASPPSTPPADQGQGN